MIVNEFGEVGIDNDLIVNADEEIFEMNNGCIFCTVRGDLIRIIEGLVKRRGKFDGIIVETTGLADPAPVAQTFIIDEDVRKRTKLDAIVTVIDAKHLLDEIESASRELDPERFMPWIKMMVQRLGMDILRMKGILALKDDPDRFVVQGVHMLIEGTPQRATRKQSGG